jgi:hypothetical protein
MNLSCLNISLTIFNCQASFLDNLKRRVLLQIQYEPFVMKGVDFVDFLLQNDETFLR